MQTVLQKTATDFTGMATQQAGLSLGLPIGAAKGSESLLHRSHTVLPGPGIGAGPRSSEAGHRTSGAGPGSSGAGLCILPIISGMKAGPKFSLQSCCVVRIMSNRKHI